MIYREFDIKSTSIDNVATEIMFEIAGARADGIELIRANVVAEDSKIVDGVVKIIKGMKQKGLVQFYADSESFEKGKTEASFLINKFPDVFSNTPIEEKGNRFIYIKI